MESYQIERLTFTYPNRETPALDTINLTIRQGEFVTLCGKSGCGKTTLLRLLKSSLAPFGTVYGSINYQGQPLASLDAKREAAEIGFVLQNPDNQIVTDKVWHELAFGLESLGVSTSEIRTRVAEMASFLGIQTWFHKDVTALSGGQKQLLNLASVMVLQPSVLILDEPTAQLDPIAAQEFLKTLEKINRELGTTVILSEHRLEEAFPISDRVVVLDGGSIIADAAPRKVGRILSKQRHDMAQALPVPMRVYGAVAGDGEYPLTVREGRDWLEGCMLNADAVPETERNVYEPILTVNDVWYRYERESHDIVRGLSLTVGKGELFVIVGGNGAGKTTALSLIAGLLTPYRGEVRCNGEKLSEIKDLYGSVLGVLPQNPQALFVKKTVYLDLLEILSESKLSQTEKDEQVRTLAAVCQISDLLGCHPYDLSGGEQQRAALCKVLLKHPQILLLDEPTKGVDAHFKRVFAAILRTLKANGVTVMMVSHDIEFCAEYADRCAMFFDGSIAAVDEPRAFFAGKSFYTTAANRMARAKLPKAVLAEDIIRAAGKDVPLAPHVPDFRLPKDPPREMPKKPRPKKLSSKRIFWGCLFAALFVVMGVLSLIGVLPEKLAPIVLLPAAGSLFCFFSQQESGVREVQQPQHQHKLSPRTLTAALLILLAIPLTLYVGVVYLEERKYYFISLLIILETMIPFCMVFESRKPQARELIVISVLCAIAVAGRGAFFMLQQFKPVVAVIIIAGVCFGGETGFLVGALTGFVSNFFFGQGPWTPWQMFAFGIIGFLAGVLFRKGLLQKTRVSLCVFGTLATLMIYGGIMNPASILMSQAYPTWELIFTSYKLGFPLDLIHAAATAFFLWFLTEPMIDKLERVKIKYGLIER